MLQIGSAAHDNDCFHMTLEYCLWLARELDASNLRDYMRCLDCISLLFWICHHLGRRNAQETRIKAIFEFEYHFVCWTTSRFNGL